MQHLLSACFSAILNYLVLFFHTVQICTSFARRHHICCTAQEADA
jgi:hypothetical protein